MIVFDIPNWQFLIQTGGGTIMTLLVGLATTRVTSPGVRAVLLAALSVLSSIVSELAAAIQANTAYDLGNALVLGLWTFLVAVGTYYGFWKHTSVPVAAQSILVKASESEVKAAEQAKALETLHKAGVATQETSPSDSITIPALKYVPRHSTRE